MENLKIYLTNAIALAISITEVNPYLQSVSLVLANGSDTILTYTGSGTYTH